MHAFTSLRGTRSLATRPRRDRLMTAAKWAASPATVNALLSANPAAAAEPLPVAPLPEVLSMTLDVSQRRAVPPPPPPSRRWRPLHLALWNRAPEGSIWALLLAHPEASHLQDRHGMTALHFAVVSQASVATISALMDVNPRAARTRDQDRLLPADYAVTHGASEEVTSLLLSGVPEEERIGSEGCAGLLFD